MQVYFSGDYARAHQMLSELISKGHVDARTHYFRGLANRRMGKPEDAARDFDKGAELELVGSGYGVGDALQRVQGMDRLVLERHRTMARLKSRRRQQPIAPPPIPKLSDNQIQLATAISPVQSPLFRLASEIPIRTPSGDLADQPTEMLAGEKMPSGPDATAIERTEPVGTGVASDVDPFADDSSSFSESTSTSDVDAGSVLGAVFRAFSKALTSGSEEEDASAFDPADDPFGESDSDPFADMGDDEDPFGL